MSPIPVKNVYNMLVYAFDLLKTKTYERLGREDCADVYNLLATLLLCGAGTLVKRGLIKSYVPTTETLRTIRGRVDFTASMLPLKNAKAICTFDVLSPDHVFNQVLKTTLIYLTQTDLQPHIQRDIHKILPHFSHVTTIAPTHIPWGQLSFNRHNIHYDTLLYFCRLILDSAIAKQNQGGNDFRTIEEKLLPKLFEKFVCAFYKKHLPQTHTVEAGRHIKWKADHTTLLPTMRTDVIITSNTQVLILDTKYYRNTLQRHYHNETIISSHLYQIFAYVKNFPQAQHQGKTLGGMLLYPQVDVAVCEAYHIDGHMYHVQTVDLNQDFCHISQALTNGIRRALSP